MCLQNIKYNLYWKMKLLKQSTYIRYVGAKLSKLVQISMLASLDSFLWRILWNLNRAWNFSRPHFSYNFLIKKLFCNVTYTGQISLPDCVYFPSYSIKCVSCFMFRHLMTSWHLNIWKIKIWSSQERKELWK